MVKSYKVNEMFYSLQGEGLRAGTANVFVRFTGCNMECTEDEVSDKSPGGFDCDTEFASGRKMCAAEIIAEANELTLDSSSKPGVIFTGGEPALQLDAELVAAFKADGWETCIETNGSIDVSSLGLDFVTVSPKVAEHAIRQMTADEVKYVRGYGQAVPKPKCKSDNNLISPAFNGLTQDRKAIGWCVSLVQENPDWRLSIQLHKTWMIR